MREVLYDSELCIAMFILELCWKGKKIRISEREQAFIFSFKLARLFRLWLMAATNHGSSTKCALQKFAPKTFSSRKSMEYESI